MSVLYTRLRPLIDTTVGIRVVKRCYSKAAQRFTEEIASAENKFQIYLSQSRHPYLNLSIEHYIYEKSYPGSTILLLYINDPCVVIGRNQNPWLEANLRQLADRRIPIIRRRSGGGTVFHDHGNVNFSVTSPRADFTRDKYAELVTKALRSYQPRARVNERHDIVLDQGDKLQPDLQPDEDDMHQSGYESHQSRKCSGSAYRLSGNRAGNRALHHGTCLITSPNLGLISSLLRSPLAPFVKAKGVDSVRSPVSNVFDGDQINGVDLFIKSVIQEFGNHHGLSIDAQHLVNQAPSTTTVTRLDSQTVFGTLSHDLQDIEPIQPSIRELQSEAWLWSQTPQFTFSSFPTKEDNRPRPALPEFLSNESRIHFTARAGSITSADIFPKSNLPAAEGDLIGINLHEIKSWSNLLAPSIDSVTEMSESTKQVKQVATWLDSLFGKG